MRYYGSAGKESTCNVGDLGSIPELGRSPGEGKGYPLQYSGLENSMDYTVAESDMMEQLSLSRHFMRPQVEMQWNIHIQYSLERRGCYLHPGSN